MIDINKEFIKKNKRWVALYSMTGSEIVKISRHIGKYPDLIITDNENIESWHPMMKSLAYLKILTTISKANRKNIEVLKSLFTSDYQTRITLHGWLNIVPAEICETFEIYNGHPGYISEYPELKGKDPQQRAWDSIDKYPVVGSVVHRVVAEVDAGYIISSDTMSSDKCTSLDETYKVLTDTSFNAWKKAINTIL
jgi:folate-dependent phosphoribosylglycinamide formyltransferase PurN